MGICWWGSGHRPPPAACLPWAFRPRMGAGFGGRGRGRRDRADLVAQLGLGASWRIGVDDTETTESPPARSRVGAQPDLHRAAGHPRIGLALMVGNLVAIAGLVIAVVGIELQVRGVEEPYLRRVHGRATPTTPLRWAASAVDRPHPRSSDDAGPMMLPDTIDFTTVG